MTNTLQPTKTYPGCGATTRRGYCDPCLNEETPMNTTDLIDPLRAELEDVNDDAEATFKASEIRALIAELDKTKRAAVTLGEIIDKQCMDVLDITGLHHMVNEDGDGDWSAIWDHLWAMKAQLDAIPEGGLARVWEQGARAAFYSDHTGSDARPPRTAFPDHDWNNPYREAAEKETAR